MHSFCSKHVNVHDAIRFSDNLTRLLIFSTGVIVRCCESSMAERPLGTSNAKVGMKEEILLIEHVQ
jgi:hypothetical protein